MRVGPFQPAAVARLTATAATTGIDHVVLLPDCAGDPVGTAENVVRLGAEVPPAGPLSPAGSARTPPVIRGSRAEAQDAGGRRAAFRGSRRVPRITPRSADRR